MPPPLDGVGAKLEPDYLKQILDKGAHDRPYMHTRMPGFGAGQRRQPWSTRSSSIDKLPSRPRSRRSRSRLAKVKAAARHMVGGKALGCIKCHTFNGKKAEGVQGIDMTHHAQAAATRLVPRLPARPAEAPARHAHARPPGQRQERPARRPRRHRQRSQIEAIWVYLQRRHQGQAADWRAAGLDPADPPTRKRSSTATSSRARARGPSASAIRRRSTWRSTPTTCGWP